MTSWTFITNYGVVLAVIAQHGHIGISKAILPRRFR